MRPGPRILAYLPLAASGGLLAMIAASPAAAAARPARAHVASRATTAPAFDIRDAARLRLAGRAPQGFAATATVRRARGAFARSLGPRAILDIDPLTQTPRLVQRLDGALSAPSAQAPATVALDYVRARASSLGLTAGDLDALNDRQAYTSGDGVTHLRWTQSYRGIPAFDNDLRVNVDRSGRVIDVLGSPRHDLRVDSTTPALDATQALHAVQSAVGATRPASVTHGPSGPTRATTFSTGDSARLVLFGAQSVRLAWDVTDHATPVAVYDAVVDATTGRILTAQNLVKFDGAVSVFAHYPGAAAGGTQTSQDITPFLTPGATTLTGPNAHVYSDVNNDRLTQAPDEEVAPSSASDWLYPFTDFTSTNLTGACLIDHQCSWDAGVSGSWMTNRQQSATQLFWFVNEYHDHLLGSPIGFDDGSGAFNGSDPLQARSDVGAALLTGASNTDLPHLDSASMLTPPDGQSPTMTTDLFSSGFGAPFRDVNSADDAATVFHEYTHGLSNRLITNNDGTGALSDVQSAAMGEGWSDWYAMDEVVNLGLDTDTPTTGEIDFGEYTDATPHATRSEAIDCPVSQGPDPNCPGTAGGGYTYGDLGHICTCGTTEPHADGEIWGQTLWDLRTALITASGSASAGSQAAEQLITGGMRLSPPQPSMLDERNAILAEDTVLGGTNHDLIWTVFAHRGMGWFASTIGPDDGSPIEDFSMPPAAGGPTGTVHGAVTDAVSGLPLAGASAGFGGHDTSHETSLIPDFADTTIAALTDSQGVYTLAGVPAGQYPELVVHGAPGYDTGVVGPISVGNAQTVTRDIALRRDWAAGAGGAMITDTNDNTQASFGCGNDNLIDQSPRGWSTQLAPPSTRTDGLASNVTIELPETIDVASFGIDPAAACGDDASAGTRGYTIETSTDGTTFQVADAGAFSAGAAGHINELSPAANASAARYVRLTLVSSQSAAGAGAAFVDVTELEVFGGPPNVLPSGTLTATPAAVDAGTMQVSLQAVFTDPDSKITGYTWDFDGNGTVDQTTTTPTVTHVYPTGGTFTAAVVAQDFRGGAGTATAQVTVTPPPVPPVVPPSAPPTTPITTPLPVVRAARPVLKLSNSGRRGVAFTVTFAAGGSARATITVSAALSTTLHLPSAHFIVGTLRAAVTTTRPRTLTVKLSAATLKALSRHHRTTLHATLGVTAIAADGQIATATRHVTIRR